MQSVREQQEPAPKLLSRSPLVSNFRIGSRVEVAAGKRRARIDAGRRPILAAAFRNPDAGAVRIDRHRAGRAPLAPVRQLPPVLDRSVGIGRGVGRRRCLSVGVMPGECQCDGGDSNHASRELRDAHCLSPSYFWLTRSVSSRSDTLRLTVARDMPSGAKSPAFHHRNRGRDRGKTIHVSVAYSAIVSFASAR